MRGGGEKASVWRRLGAFGVDYLVIAAYLGLLTFVAVSSPAMADVFEGSPGRAHAAGFAILTLPVLVYFAGCEASSWGATLGKRAAGIEVRATSGGALGLRRALARNALKLVPWELAHALLWRIPGWPQPTGELPTWAVVGFGVVWALVLLNLALASTTSTGQTAYDWASGSMVVRAPGPSTAARSRWNGP